MLFHAEFQLTQTLQQPKGFGYVQFSSVDEAKAALAMNGEYIEGRPCRFRLFNPRDNTNNNNNNNRRGGFAVVLAVVKDQLPKIR